MTWKNNHVFSIFSGIFWQALALPLAGLYLLFRLIVPLKQGSHPISKFFRKIFESQKAKTYFTVLLLISIFITNFYLTQSTSIHAQEQQVLITTSQDVVTTQTTYQKPTIGYLSQGYKWYHLGIDIANAQDTPVYPIAKGRVIAVEHRRWGYGHFIIIQHDMNVQALYAHFGKINVKIGDKVNKDTQLGLIGMTGYTTGPHLHLEVYENGTNINPIEVVPDVIL